jgi:hypothetical protein
MFDTWCTICLIAMPFYLLYRLIRWVVRKISRFAEYASSGEMEYDRKVRSARNYQRRSRNLDKALKEGSVDHDTYVRAQIWLEKLRDF